MPSIKMKAKLSSSCLREKHGLRVCQKSSVISKKACFLPRVSEETDEFNGCITQCLEVSLNTESINSNINQEAIDHQEFIDEETSELKRHGEAFELKREEPFSVNAADMNGMGENWILIYQERKLMKGKISEAHMTIRPVIGTDDLCNINYFHDYKYTQSTILSDVADQYMMLPFLEDTVKFSNSDDADCSDELTIGFGNSGLHRVIDQRNNFSLEFNVSTDSDQTECFDPQLFIKNLPELSEVISNFQPSILPNEDRKRKAVTLVLDLDETLVHSTLEPQDDADFCFTVCLNMKEHIVYVKQRPYLQIFLDRVAEMFEVVIFTASQSIYAEQVLNKLDPDNCIISRRLYRESCIFLEGCYTKDLTVLGIDLAKVVIVDNYPQVFRLQVNNGIPIKSWIDDPLDSALISLLPFLETLADADDVRPIIVQRFGNKE
ncbi:CTD small phosphatase-like protein 2 [Cucurbita argyrosperma subsp. argyrosperma]|nr:CTD small phosphatase-like protein 2 [Cucurbita argyrosperma subsp. argyrosperma]